MTKLPEKYQTILQNYTGTKSTKIDNKAKLDTFSQALLYSKLLLAVQKTFDTLFVDQKIQTQEYILQYKIESLEIKISLKIIQPQLKNFLTMELETFSREFIQQLSNQSITQEYSYQIKII